LFTLIARSPQLLPTGHVAVPELSCARRREPGPRDVAVPELPRALVAGVGATRHMAAPELPYAGRCESCDTRACGGDRAVAGPGGGSWSHEARGGPRVVPCPETGAGATGHVAVPELPRALMAGARAMRHAAAPELPSARRREPRGMRVCVPVLPFVFDLKLVCGGTRSSGYRQWPPSPLGRGYEPAGGANILPRAAFLSFVRWDFEAVTQYGGYVVAHDSRGTLRCSERLAEPSCATVLHGLLLHSRSHGARGNHDHDLEPMRHRAAEVAGVEAIVSTIPEPTEHRSYEMCVTFCFYAVIVLGLLLLSLALTDAWDLGPLVSVWVWPVRGAVMKHRACWAAAGRGA
jgi:hypothetical protein